MNTPNSDRPAFCFPAPQASFCFPQQGDTRLRPTIKLELTDLTKVVRS